jgi:transposase
MGGVTPDGRLLVQLLTGPVDSEAIIVWLDWLQQKVPGKLWILWDGAPIHRSERLREYLADGAGQRIHLERFPGYAPELNPAEGIWQHLKHVELRNCCCADLTALRKEITAAIKRMRENMELVKAFFRQVGY